MGVIAGTDGIGRRQPVTVAGVDIGSQDRRGPRQRSLTSGVVDRDLVGPSEMQQHAGMSGHRLVGETVDDGPDVDRVETIDAAGRHRGHDLSGPIRVACRDECAQRHQELTSEQVAVGRSAGHRGIERPFERQPGRRPGRGAPTSRRVWP